MIAFNFLIPSILFVAIINLFTPFITKKDSAIRNFLLILTSICLLINILITDRFFLKGITIKTTTFIIGNYWIAFHLEAMGLIFLNLIGFLWVCSLLYTTKYLQKNNIENSNNFLFFLNLCVFCGILVALSANLFTMFVSYELLTLATIPLITHQYSPNVQDSLYRYLRILMISSLTLFMPAVIVIYAKAGHGDFIIGGFIESNFSKVQSIILLLMFIFGISKSALYPLHNWLPSAMVASYPVSALLHAVVVVKAGLFCTYKILVYIFGLDYLQFIFGEFNWIIIFPIITIFYSSLKAISTDNIKRVLAYSTINQLAIALLSMFMFTPKALLAALLHMISHSFSKICLFYCVGNFYTAKNTYLISDLQGIFKQLPKTSFILAISIISLIGVPPFGGFISKFYIMTAAAEQDQIFVMITLAFSTLLTTIYMLKILLPVYKFSLDNKMNNIEKIIPTFMMISIYICCLGTVLFAFVYQLIKQFLLYL